MSGLVTVLAGFVPAFVVNTDAQAFPLHVPCVWQDVACADQRLVLVEMATSAVGVQSSALAMGRCCCGSLPLSYQRESFSTCKLYCEYPVKPCVCDFCDQHANHS